MTLEDYVEQAAARRAEAIRWLALNGPDPAEAVAAAEGTSPDPDGALREQRHHVQELGAARSDQAWRRYLEAHPERAREIVEGMNNAAR